MLRILRILALGMLGQAAAAQTTLDVGYLHVEVARAPTLSNLDHIHENK